MLNSCDFTEEDKYPISYVAINQVGFRQDITYIYGELRLLPNGNTRCRIRCVDGSISEDSVDFGNTTNIVPASIWFIK
ncbi:MAG: hypothetical protein WDK96_03465 [Candidatus Paceibacterota bacterium]